MNEDEARKYIKNLILSSSPIRDKAMERFKKRYGHSFWQTSNPVSNLDNNSTNEIRPEKLKEEDPYSEEFWTK